MPGLQFENLPAQQANEIKGTLHTQWQIEADALNKSWFSDRGKFETAKAKLNAKYQRLEFDAFTNLQQQQQEQQQKQQLLAGYRKKQQAGGIGKEEEAGLRLQFKPPEEEFIFGEEKYLSPQYLRSKGFIETIKAYAKSAKGTKAWDWGKKQKQSLIDRYQEWREEELYSTKSPQEQQQLDKEWDELMLSDDNYNTWWENKKARKPITEVRALRATGRIADAMQDKVVTPLGRSLGRRKKSLIEKTYGTGAEMRERYGLAKRAEPQQQKPIRQRNRLTGQERISYDGGKTWKVIG